MVLSLKNMRLVLVNPVGTSERHYWPGKVRACVTGAHSRSLLTGNPSVVAILGSDGAISARGGTILHGCRMICRAYHDESAFTSFR